MCLIFCRFGFLLGILLQIEKEVGSVNNDPRIQVLLTNSSFSIDKLVYRSKNEMDEDEVPTHKKCKKQISDWFKNLNMLKNGKCENQSECKDALDQLDAFARFPSPGSPNIYDGSYEKCNELNKNGGNRKKYCYVIQADEEHKTCREDYHSVLFEPNRTAFGICGPEVCHGKDFAKIFQNLKKPFNFMMDRPVCAVFCTDRDIPKKTMFYVFTSFLIMLASIVFFASLYDYIRDTRYRLSAEDEKVFGQRAILSWSLWSNIEFLFNDHHPGYIKSLDCLRSITFTWIVGQNVVGHLAFYDKNLRLTEDITIASSALSSIMPIYTYLFISGLTVTYTFIRAKPSWNVLKRPITWLVFYFHRWIRLTSALMVFIGFFDAYGKYIQGPYDALTGYSMVTQTDQCDYWRDILHISNFKEVDKMCYLPAWHLAVDFQFTLIAPIFLIAFYYSSRLGTTLAIIASLIGSGCTVLFFTQNSNLHSAFTGDHRLDDKLVEIILSKPWNQLAPYMIGMIVGYFLAKHYNSRRIMHPAASSIIWVIVTVLGMCSLMFGNQGSNQYERAIVNVVTRAVWSICLIWIIVSSQMQWAGPIGHFLEHSFWRPFGRLSYCAFIVHHMALYFLFNMEEQAPKYVSFWHEYFHYTVPIVIYSYFVAFFLSLFVEVPMIRLDKIILDKCIPASKLDDNESLINEDDDDDSDIEPGTKEGFEDFSDKSSENTKSDEKSTEDQKEENERKTEELPKKENSFEEPLLSSEYY
ncbi:CBN-OAC-50 protein [Caenorhabditis brenneri]|uniref:CBN-OAC-50 protein n=1 Tax=Caenorhabditis brenneri TaxID=135651 RepID=G0NU12_CAEBE|nr:CBN-OAC-50 protein [Caenorhabditis brenneri]